MGFFANNYKIFFFFDDFFRILLCFFHMRARRIDNVKPFFFCFPVYIWSYSVGTDEDRIPSLERIQRVYR